MTHYCTFCGKSRDMVRMLVAGPANNFICNECVDLCYDIAHRKPGTPLLPLPRNEALDLAEVLGALSAATNKAVSALLDFSSATRKADAKGDIVGFREDADER